MKNKEVNHGLKASHCLKWPSHCLFIWHNSDRNSQVWSVTESSIRCITIKGRFLMLHFYSNLLKTPENFKCFCICIKSQIRILSGCSDLVYWMTNGMKIRKSGLLSTFFCLFVWFFKSLCALVSPSLKRGTFHLSLFVKYFNQLNLVHRWKVLFIISCSVPAAHGHLGNGLIRCRCTVHLWDYFCARTN